MLSYSDATTLILSVRQHLTRPGTTFILQPGAQNLPPWIRRLRWDWPGTP